MPGCKIATLYRTTKLFTFAKQKQTGTDFEVGNVTMWEKFCGKVTYDYGK